MDPAGIKYVGESTPARKTGDRGKYDPLESIIGTVVYQFRNDVNVEQAGKRAQTSR